MVNNMSIKEYVYNTPWEELFADVVNLAVGVFEFTESNQYTKEGEEFFAVCYREINCNFYFVMHLNIKNKEIDFISTGYSIHSMEVDK